MYQLSSWKLAYLDLLGPSIPTDLPHRLSPVIFQCQTHPSLFCNNFFTDLPPFPFLHTYIYIYNICSAVVILVFLTMVIDQDEDDVDSLSIDKSKQKADVFGLWVKLKIPNEHREKEEDEGMYINGDQCENKNQMNKYSNNTKRVCHICHKEFNSGKALGGHMRIHVQLSHKKEDVILKKKLKSSDKKVIEKAICKICSKDFPSMKSLFGHMRCHPERNWRGIHPPLKNTSSSSSSSLSDAEPSKIDDQMGNFSSGEKIRAVDLTQSLMRWPVTAKRGRKATDVGSSSELDDQLRDAVNYLMMLAHGESVNKLEDSANYVHNYDISSKSNQDSESSNLNVVIKNMMIKKRKKVKLCDLTPSEDHKMVELASIGERRHDKYRCNTRDKSFTTHQALGGHRSSHNKFNIAKEDNKVFDIDLNEVPPLEDEAGFRSELAFSW